MHSLRAQSPKVVRDGGAAGGDRHVELEVEQRSDDGQEKSGWVPEKRHRPEPDVRQPPPGGTVLVPGVREPWSKDTSVRQPRLGGVQRGRARIEHRGAVELGAAW